MSKEYPCFTIAQIAEIPEDVLPDFLAEFPDFIRHARQIKAASAELAAELKSQAPWPWRHLPLAVFVATVETGLQRAIFRNDKKGTITVKARIKEGSPDFYSRTEDLKS